MSSDNNPKKRKGLKINNEGSTVPTPKPNATAAFNEQAEKVFSKIEEYKQRSFELGTKFKNIFEDRKLAVNKTQINRDIESEILTKLVMLANDINSDENQPEGAGGVALGMLIMKIMLIQRDTINDMAFKIDRLEKALNGLASKVETNKTS